MGILIVMGMMSYAAGLCCLFRRIDGRSPRVSVMEDRPDGLPIGVVIPDRVPPAWVEAYRSGQGG